jgi:uncharacterized protein (TIGR00369 family)
MRFAAYVSGKTDGCGDGAAGYGDIMADDAPPTGFDPQRMFRAMERHGHSQALGLLYRGHGPDWAELAMPWRAELVGNADTQTVSTGAMIGLMDMAGGVAVWTTLDAFRPQVTLDLRIDYVRAATPGETVIARVECYRTTRDIAFVRGIAHDGNAADPVAGMTALFMFTGPAMAFDRNAAMPIGRGT